MNLKSLLHVPSDMYANFHLDQLWNENVFRTFKFLPGAGQAVTALR